MKKENEKKDEVKQEKVTQDEVKKDEVKKESPKPEAKKEEAKKEEAKKEEAKKEEPKKEEAKGQEKPKQESPKPEAKKEEAKKEEVKKEEVKKEEAKKEEPKKEEAKGQEKPKQESPKPEVKKEEVKKEEAKKEEASPKLGLYGNLVVILLALTTALNFCCVSSAFCDWYKSTIYGVISDGLGRMTAWIPFPLGEILGYLGAIALILGVILLPLLLFFRKKPSFRKFTAVFWKGLFLVLVITFFVYTLNWIIPFNGTVLKVKGAKERTYSLKEIQNVRNYLVKQLNACAEEVTRDEEGYVIYDREKMAKATFKAMQEQAKDYPLLSGFYPPMKDALCSDFLDWMDIGGYTYPYTMEITWNVYCTDFYYPTLLAHESSHHQGYYQENEANFIAFLACTQSEDPLIRYSGYEDAYEYVNHVYVTAVLECMDRSDAVEYLKKQPVVSDLVKQDREHAWETSRQRYEAVSHPAQQFETVSAQVADVGWSTQAEILQENGYDGVVKMILDYYDVENGGLDHEF